MSDIKEKFFFDHNIFDEDGNIEAELVEEGPPPPPTFSEAELEIAKKTSFQKGHAQAAQEAKDSREHVISVTLSRFADDISDLFAQEALREKTYEQEVVALTLQIFKKLFPHYAAETGFTELKAAMQQVLDNYTGKSGVLVRVHPEILSDVEAFIGDVKARNAELLITVKADESLDEHGYALSWDSGGALHNSAAIAQDVLDILKDGLAGEPLSRHDRDEQSDDALSERNIPKSGASSDMMNETNPPLEEKPDE